MEREYVFPCPHCNKMLKTATDGNYLKAVIKFEEEKNEKI